MTKPTAKPKSEYAIQTVQNALRLLEAFDHEVELGVSELSRRLDLHKNNVFRLLATLEQSGYIEQCSDSDRYRLGVRCLELGRAYERGFDLLSSARRVLQRLAVELGETAHIAVLQDFEVVHLHGEEPSQTVFCVRRTGQRMPAHCTALGKVLLAASGDEVLQRYDRDHVSRGALSAHRERTIVDREKLFEHLRSVAVQGFALDLEEYELGLCCAAAPVYDGVGQLQAAVSVSGPSFRLSEDRILDEIVPAITQAAQGLGRGLGG
ncbi:MAG: IclR family transcriptional regulator [Myxococcota bacterium]